SVSLPGPRRAGRSEIKVSPIPRCKQRGVNSLQDDRCLQSAGYYSFLCRFSPISSPKEKQPFPATHTELIMALLRGSRAVVKGREYIPLGSSSPGDDTSVFFLTQTGPSPLSLHWRRRFRLQVNE
ncbi:Protein phosphatase 1J, partial [Dissostichus eleginoides]